MAFLFRPGGPQVGVVCAPAADISVVPDQAQPRRLPARVSTFANVNRAIAVAVTHASGSACSCGIAQRDHGRFSV
jgi:hypothetical protein